jgi:hypothetical protein
MWFVIPCGENLQEENSLFRAFNASQYPESLSPARLCIGSLYTALTQKWSFRAEFDRSCGYESTGWPCILSRNEKFWELTKPTLLKNKRWGWHGCEDIDIGVRVVTPCELEGRYRRFGGLYVSIFLKPEDQRWYSLICLHVGILMYTILGNKDWRKLHRKELQIHTLHILF